MALQTIILIISVLGCFDSDRDTAQMFGFFLVAILITLLFGSLAYNAGRRQMELEAVEARVGKFYLDKNNDRKFCFTPSNKPAESVEK